MKKEIFDSFFIPYSKTVDNVADASAFWRFSDAIITEIIRLEIAPYCTEDSLVMDAGGGTGRWAIKLCSFLKGKIIVFDRSAEMLAKARESIARSNYSDRIKIIEGNLIEIKEFGDESINHIVSIYSPISFIYEQEKLASELFRVIRPGGRILIMSHGYFNALASKINNYFVSTNELNKLHTTSRVKWANHVPELITHSKETIEKLFKQAGFLPIKTYGIPIIVQPGKEDFDPSNQQQSNISKYLENRDNFKALFELEMKYNSGDSVANRGMNIFMLAEKQKNK